MLFFSSEYSSTAIVVRWVARHVTSWLVILSVAYPVCLKTLSYSSMKPQARVLFGLVVFSSEKSGIVNLMGSTRFLIVRSLICM